MTFSPHLAHIQRRSTRRRSSRAAWCGRTMDGLDPERQQRGRQPGTGPAAGNRAKVDLLARPSATAWLTLSDFSLLHDRRDDRSPSWTRVSAVTAGTMQGPQRLSKDHGLKPWLSRHDLWPVNGPGADRLGTTPPFSPPAAELRFTANQFQMLQVDDANEEEKQPNEDHPPVKERQPPITVIKDENKTFAIIRELNKSTKNLKISKVKDGIRIHTTSPEDKETVQSTCDKLKLETYTWAANSAKPIRAVINRLSSDVPTEDLQEELKGLNFEINSVTQIIKKLMVTKSPSQCL
ncbi:hypothetical protein C0J52_24533 [Blattella germanica]|nr:hypothetical protein C0J52_24533 [Blattella germanica]